MYHTAHPGFRHSRRTARHSAAPRCRASRPVLLSPRAPHLHLQLQQNIQNIRGEGKVGVGAGGWRGEGGVRWRLSPPTSHAS